MSTVVYANIDDYKLSSGAQATWAAARDAASATASTGVAGTSVGVAFNGTSYFAEQYLAHFDTSGSSGSTGILSVFGYTAASGVTLDIALKSWTTADTSNWTLGSNLASLTALHTGTSFSSAADVRRTFALSGLTASSSLGLLIYGQKQRTNVTPTTSESFSFYHTDNAGTTNDPFLIVGDQVTYVGSGAAANNAAACTYPVPTGIANNDILVLLVETANEPASGIPTTPTDLTFSTGGTGWSKKIAVGNDAAAGGTNSTALWVYWKRTTGTETAPTIADPGNHQIGRMFAFRGCATTGDPFDVVGTAVKSSTGGTSFTIPGATTTVDGCMVLDAVASGADIGTSQLTYTAPTGLVGYEEVADDFTAVQAGGGIGLAIGIKEVAGAIGTTAVSIATSNSHVGFKLALKPQVSAPPGTAITPANIAQAQSTQSPTLAAKSSVAPANVAQAQSTTSPSVAPKFSVVPDNAAQAQSVASPSVAYFPPAVAVTPANVAQAQSTTLPTIAAKSTLAPVDVAQTQSTTSPTVAAKSTIAPENVAQAQSTESPTLGAKSTVAPAAVVQAQSTTSPTIATQNTIAPVNVAQAQSTTSPTLGAKSSIAPANVSQAQSTTSPTVAAKSIMVPADAAQSHGATEPTLATANAVAPADALQSQEATSPTLAAGSVIAPENASQGQSSTSPTLSVLGVIGVEGSSQAQATTSPALMAGASVTPVSVTQTHSSTQPTLQAVILPVSIVANDNYHSHVSTSPTLVYNEPRWVFTKNSESGGLSFASDTRPPAMSFTVTAAPPLLTLEDEASSGWTFTRDDAPDTWAA